LAGEPQHNRQIVFCVCLYVSKAYLNLFLPIIGADQMKAKSSANEKYKGFKGDLAKQI